MVATGDVELIDTRVSSMHPTRPRDSRWSPHTLHRLTPHAAWARQVRSTRSISTEMDSEMRYSLLGFIIPDGNGDKVVHCMHSFNVIDLLQTSLDPHVIAFCKGKGLLSSRLKGVVPEVILALCPDAENNKHTLGKFIKNTFFRGEPDIKTVGALRDLRCTGVKKLGRSCSG